MFPPVVNFRFSGQNQFKTKNGVAKIVKLIKQLYTGGPFEPYYLVSLNGFKTPFSESEIEELLSSEDWQKIN